MRRAGRYRSGAHQTPRRAWGSERPGRLNDGCHKKRIDCGRMKGKLEEKKRKE